MPYVKVFEPTPPNTQAQRTAKPVRCSDWLGAAAEGASHQTPTDDVERPEHTVETTNDQEPATPCLDTKGLPRRVA